MRQHASSTKRSRATAICTAIGLTDDGLVFGAGTILARMTEGGLSLGSDRERVLALLAVAYRHPISPDVLLHFHEASAHWQRGDKALANLRLLFAGLPRLDDAADADRLRLAERLLDRGMPPRALMEELGFDLAALDLEKFDPAQPRVPAGSGRTSGQWGQAAATAATALARAGQSFLAGAAPRIVASLAAFGARFSVPAAVLGALFIPTPNSGGISEGDLPGSPDIRFRKDGPQGTVRLTTTAADGTPITVFAQNQRGLIVNLRTDKAIGRDFGSQLYFDLDGVRGAIGTEAELAGKSEPERRPKAATDEPKLCPAPTPDTAHGASQAAKDYEDDVHARVNPLAPLPQGFGVSLPDPRTGKLVYFDDCFRYGGDLVDGDMKAGDLVEAKGARYASLLLMTFGENLMEEFVNQAEKQEAVAERRGVGLKWYFAERGAADMVRERFKDEGLAGIVVSFMPPRKSK